jgi:hypothetical protein
VATWRADRGCDGGHVVAETQVSKVSLT